LSELSYSCIQDRRIPKNWLDREIDHAMAEKVWAVLKAAEAPIVFRVQRESRPVWHFGETATEHRVSVRMTPVQTERIVMHEFDRVDRVKQWPKPTTLGQRIKSWWREMTSEVVYDGPRG